LSDFEKKIWDDFWRIANDPQRSAELGIRALHGDAVSIKVEKGKTYRVTVRASGGPEIVVEPDTPPGKQSSTQSPERRTRSRLIRPVKPGLHVGRNPELFRRSRAFQDCARAPHPANQASIHPNLTHQQGRQKKCIFPVPLVAFPVDLVICIDLQVRDGWGNWGSHVMGQGFDHARIAHLSGVFAISCRQ